jgi:mono/diheme cytochrome c family protein
MRTAFGVVLIGSFLLALPGAEAGPPTAEQRERLAEATKLKSRLSVQLQRRRYDEARTLLGQLAETIDTLKADGVSEKEPQLMQLQRFLDSQKKLLEKNEPKQSGPKEKPGGPPPASGTESAASGGVSFVKDVAPIFARNCMGCHGANNPRSKFNLSMFKTLMQGGQRGDDIVAGKPDESLLVLMLQGKEEPRMPRNGRKLRNELIEKVELWVKEGAKFDGAPQFTPETPLAQIVPSAEQLLRAKVAAMSESELVDLHKSLAREQWGTANASRTPASAETEHFLLYGTVDPPALEQAGQWAESTLKDLNRIFARSPHDSAWRGKLTVHVFADRHQYSEHAMMIENRELPEEVNGHHFQMIETEYVALYAPRGESGKSLRALVVEQVAGAYAAALGDTPRWFNVGLGHYLAARTDPKSDAYRDERQDVREALVGGGDPLAGVADGQGSANADVLGFGLVEFLMSQRQGEKGLAALATPMRQKTPADKAIQAVYGLDRKALLAAWATYATKRYPVAKRH